MEIDRRQFLALTSCAATCTALGGVLGGALDGIACADDAPVASANAITVDAGPAANFAKDGLYSDFRAQGFFLIRLGTQLTALSSVCTHRRIGLIARPDSTFYCHKHGSIFAEDGHVLKGPAKRPLPALATTVDPATGHLMVTVPAAI